MSALHKLSDLAFKKEKNFFLLFVLMLFIFVYFSFELLQPVYISMVLAYIFDPIHKALKKYGLAHSLATTCLLIFFLSTVTLSLLSVLPILSQEILNLFKEVPDLISTIQHYLEHRWANAAWIKNIMPFDFLLDTFKKNINKISSNIVHASLASFSGLLDIIVYMMLVPILTFLFIHDRDKFLAWGKTWLPKERKMLSTFSDNINAQMGLYLRGKMLEMILVFIVSSIVFKYLSMNYSLLMSACIALSTLIPVIGAVLATIPMLTIGLLQWGLSPAFYSMLLAYTLIMILDGYILVPLLFGGRLNLHASVILISIFFFGNLFGFWGVFFAIPLACIIKSLLEVIQKA
jgi:putative permease